MRVLLLIGLTLVAACGNETSSNSANATSADAAVDSATDADTDIGSDVCVGATGCNGPCEPGNADGVGKYCTRNGEECRTNRFAKFCTVDYEDTEFSFCTRPCQEDADCGDGAVCEGQGGQFGCFPVFCADEPTNNAPDAGLDTAD